jgi:polar amino acid transport system substrate-binding protein
VQLALASGMDAGGVVGRDDPKTMVVAQSSGYGADGVLIAAHSQSNDPLVLAAELARERGRVVALGLVNLDVPRRTFFEKEIRLEVSRAYGAGAYDAEYERKGHDYPHGYVRWTEGRNLAAFTDLMAQGRVDVRPLITHRFTLDAAKDAYAVVLGERKEGHLGVVFEYAAPHEKTPTLRLRPPEPAPRAANPLTFGVIGAGRFAQAVLLPELTAQGGVRIAAVATAQGMTARHIAAKYGSDMCSSDHREVLARPDIGSVLIATRHASHAAIVCDAMTAGKNVFVEKPLATDEEQLARIIAAHERYQGTLMVGFNRRYSPLCRELKLRLAARQAPVAMNWRFITPLIGKGHESEWVHDRDSGGGRIIGEVCHMVDTCAYLIDRPVVNVYARSIGGNLRALHNYDTLHITIAYDDGSIATLVYVANSDASIPSERLECHWEGAYAEIDNFKSALFSRKRKRERRFGLNQQKGWKEEVREFVECVRQGRPGPVPFTSLVETTRVTFAVERSLERGAAVSLATERAIDADRAVPDPTAVSS